MSEEKREERIQYISDLLQELIVFLGGDQPMDDHVGRLALSFIRGKGLSPEEAFILALALGKSASNLVINPYAYVNAVDAIIQEYLDETVVH